MNRLMSLPRNRSLEEAKPKEATGCPRKEKNLLLAGIRKLGTFMTLGFFHKFVITGKIVERSYYFLVLIIFNGLLLNVNY